MKKSKKIDELSYGICTLQAINPWSDTESLNIEAIQKKYEFKSYNLAENLYKKISAVASIPQVIKCNPSEEEQIDYIDELLDTFSYSNELLSDGKMGARIRKRIIAGLPNGAKTFEDLDVLMSQMKLACTQARMGIKHAILSRPAQRPPNSLPKNSDTNRIKSLKKALLRCLCDVFIEGSSLPATHGTDAYSDEHAYIGNLYNFIIEIKPLLEKKLEIKLGTSATIGRYLNDIRPKKHEKFN